VSNAKQLVEQLLTERMTFSQLMRYAEPRRVARSQTVRGGPLKIETFEDSVFHVFNFKSFPSTTGNRHHGYIKFFKPRSPRPLEDLECLVDCDCPDMKFVHAWANKQRGSGVVGPQSMNRAWNRAPRIKNPGSVPGACKHVIRLKDYITGLSSSEIFGQGSPDDSTMMRTLMRYANNRWTDNPEDDQEALDREAEVQATRLQRNRGQLPSNAPPPPESAISQAPPAGEEGEEGEIGEEPPSTTNPTNPTNPENQPNVANGFTPPEEGPVPPAPPRRRRRNVGDSVDILGMSNYSAEIKLCEELEASELEADNEGAKPAAPELEATEGDEPSEALELLRQIRDFLATMSGAESAEADAETKEAGEEGEETEPETETLPVDANSYHDA
jgi:hypothetical protein